MTKAGKWATLTVGPAIGRDQTCVAVAAWDNEGNLAGWRFSGFARAVQRGDLAESMRDAVPAIPQTLDELEKRRTGLGYVMSAIRWDEPLATLRWDDRTLDRMYEMMVPDTPAVNA